MKTTRRTGWELRSMRFPLDLRHGRYPLSVARLLSAGELVSVTGDRTLAGYHLPGTLFFDIETSCIDDDMTFPFLVGCAWVDGDALQMRQFFLTDPAAEGEMLWELHALFREFDGVGTYNGRSFDMPAVARRMGCHGVCEEFSFGFHLDLLLAARRLWRGAIPSCRLGTVENEVLGLARRGDVEGRLIPGRYLRFLESGDRRPLRAVLGHNLLDVRSMIVLAGVTAMAARGEGPSLGMPPEVAYAVDGEELLMVAEALPETAPEEPPGPHQVKVADELAALLERHGRGDEAQRLRREFGLPEPAPLARRPIRAGRMARG